MGYPVNRELDEHLFHCWNQGLGIGMTKVSVSRVFKHKMTSEEVQMTFAKISNKFHKPKPVAPPPKPEPVPKEVKDFSKDYSRKCEVCDETPVVHITGMCGPCTFGEADTAGGNW